MSTTEGRINCLKCKYFYITWDKKFPRGCKAYGFKTGYLPSLVVWQSSGMDCLKYEAKPVSPSVKKNLP